MSAQETFLREWHAQHTGASDSVFGDGLLADGRTSYQALAAHARGRVLDLACGDGPLSALLPGLVIGLDMSPDELAAARRRLGPLAELQQGRAQDLPFPGEHFDAVLCHMAFMLMDDAPQVVAEVRRVLKPRGSFGFMVGREWAPPAHMQPIFDKLQDLRERFEQPPPPPLGDPRCRTIAGLSELFRGWALRCEDLDLEVYVPARELPAFLRVAFYGVAGLGDEALTELDRWLLAEVGSVEWSFSLRLGVATAPPRSSRESG